MKFGVALSGCHPALHLDVAVAADELGYESVWMAEHLVFPVDMSGSPHPGEDLPPVPPSTPVFPSRAGGPCWRAVVAGRGGDRWSTRLYSSRG
ncbi:MAG: hypothetical protein QF391_12650 [Myxococcota bacterium]|nr:hypothetical protein [Myxococcota bacterium]